MVEAMDQAVGKVLKSLDDNGLTDDTIVVFFSDNGGLSTSEGSPTSNLPYRAGKGWTYEGGIREPLLGALARQGETRQHLRRARHLHRFLPDAARGLRLRPAARSSTRTA